MVRKKESRMVCVLGGCRMMLGRKAGRGREVK